MFANMYNIFYPYVFKLSVYETLNLMYFTNVYFLTEFLNKRYSFIRAHLKKALLFSKSDPEAHKCTAFVTTLPPEGPLQCT